jgi:hypothetical protein
MQSQKLYCALAQGSFKPVDILAYVISSLSILWAFANRQTDVFWTRILIAGPICLAIALLLLKKRKELPALKPNSGSWMMGVGIGVAYSLLGLLIAWYFNNKGSNNIHNLKDFTVLGLAVWVLILSPACEIIYRKVLGPSWGTKSSAFVEALNFGVGAVNFYLFCLIFIWSYIGSKYTMRFGLFASIVARSLATLLIFLSFKALK